MLDLVIRQNLDRMNGTAYKYKLGALLDGMQNTVTGLYDFSKLGGSIGSKTLLDTEGQQVVLPANALITKAYFLVTKTFTSGGSATVALHLASGGDLLAATAVASFTNNSILAGVEDGATANMLKLSAAKPLKLDIAVAALTAGKLVAYVNYVLVPSF